MEKFSEDISSFYWWLSVVFVGLLVNILSNKLDAHLSKVSTWWAERSKQRREKRDEIVSLFQHDKDERTFAQFTELRYMMYAIILMIFSLILLVFASYVNNVLVQQILILISGVSLLPVFYFHQKVVYLSDIIKRSRDGKANIW
jgi:hypothetical protein